MKERRQHTRAIRPLQGSWNQGPAFGQLRIANLSAGGCFVEWLDPTPPAGLFRLQVRLLPGGSIWLSGEVVRTQPGVGCGVRFLNLTDDDRRTLTRAVQYLLVALRPRDEYTS